VKYIIGLTGLIGSGKSLAADIFRDLGVDVIDTDIIAHQITSANGIAIKEIYDTFGDKFIKDSGELNRSLMRELVFSDPWSRHKLENILYPLIFAEVQNEVNTSSQSYLIVVVPLLFKSVKYINLIQRSIFVDCKEDVLIKRVINRSVINEQDVKKILNAQMPQSLQLVLCDDIIDNNSHITSLKEQIIKLNNNYKKIFKDVAV
jgi:dephospho-CoA kinase